MDTLLVLYLQDLEEQKRTKYKINGTRTRTHTISARVPTVRTVPVLIRLSLTLNPKQCAQADADANADAHADAYRRFPSFRKGKIRAEIFENIIARKHISFSFM